MPRKTDSEVRNATRDDRLLTVDQVAERLSVSIRMVHRLAASGCLAKVKIGRSTRFRLTEVEMLSQKGAT